MNLESWAGIAGILTVSPQLLVDRIVPCKVCRARHIHHIVRLKRKAFFKKEIELYELNLRQCDRGVL